MVLPVSEGMAGSAISCSCGRTVPVPSLRELRREAIMDVLPADVGHVDNLPDGEQASWHLAPRPDEPGPEPLTEVIGPTRVALRIEERLPGMAVDQPVLRANVMAALTGETLWLQDTWQLRAWPLSTVASIGDRRGGKELTLDFQPETSTDSLRLTLTFSSAVEGRRWLRELQARLQPGFHGWDSRLPEGVALVNQAPDVPHVVIGRIAYSDQSLWQAERGLQLRAGMRGADAIIHVERHRCADMGAGARHVSGMAVRVEDADGRQRLRLRWFAEAVNALVHRALLLLVIQAILLFLVNVFCVGISGLNRATGETQAQALASTGLALGLVYVWPLVMLALLRLLRWPQLLRTAGIAVLAATTLRGLAVWSGHVLAAWTTGAALTGWHLWILVDPVDWAFVVMGLLLCVRAWRLAGEAPRILPLELQVASSPRKVWAGGLLALTGLYALALVGLAGKARYDESAFLLQPGVDPKREQQALLALNEGSDLANREELDAADRSLQRALRLWEELTAKPPVPTLYRANLAMTLNDLGWLRQKQGRMEEAEKYYARAVAIADELGDDPKLDDEFKQTLNDARQALAGMRNAQLREDLDAKEQTASRKYEQAQVKAAKGEAEAERLYREAIDLWQEILPRATNPEYRKSTIAQIALSYLQIGELQQQQGKRAEAETSLKKAIEYGETAVALDPDRPLAKHNLEVARNTLCRLLEQAFLKEFTRLRDAQRFADVIEFCESSIEELEEKLRQRRDADTTGRRLAFRLDRFAWFLAHCPAEGSRDPKAAVKRALQATELQPDVAGYWYTLAVAHYRNGAWRDSLRSLDKGRAGADEFDALDWLLTAMNRHQLKEPNQAKSALRKAVEWIEVQERKARDNALLQYQLELMRPAVESLRREAEDLIQGKDPSNKGIG
jgi:tetratricopeptide (TPR) repeat protein